MVSESTPAAGDSAFRGLVIDVLERLDQNEPDALEDACRAHPECAPRLRERVGALVQLGLVGGSAPLQRIGEFNLIETIGAGGMGVVYRAEQPSLGREVALKVIRPEILEFSKARERFERETAVIARLQHPGIVPIYSVGNDGSVPYYAMEWVRGCTLEQALTELEGRAAGDLSGSDLQAAVRARSPADAAQEDDAGSYLFEGRWEQVCLRIVRQVADALEHAHRRGVLHRDVKPGNILITSAGRVMLVDFGLSQAEGEQSLTRSGERVGSVHYMSPELLRSGPQQLDCRSDVYSLGVTLFRILTLQLPFSGASEVAVMHSVLEGRPRRPREVAPSLSWEAETVCLSAMDRDPERRYPTAAAFARDLENALDRRPIEARRAGLRLRTWRWIERRPGEASALALALLFVVSVPSLVAWFQAREARRAEESLASVRLEQQRTETQRTLAEEQRRRAQENALLAEEQRGAAEENYRLALETVHTLLDKVGEERLNDVPGMAELRTELAAAAERVYAELHARQPDDADLARLMAGSRRVQAIALLDRGRFDESKELMERTAASLEPWLEGGSYELRRQHALCLAAIASLDVDVDKQVAAMSAMRALIQERPEDLDLAFFLVQASRVDSMLLSSAGDQAAARAAIERSEAEARELVERAPDTDSHTVLAKALMLHGGILWNAGRHADARAKYEQGLEVLAPLIEREPGDLGLRSLESEIAAQLGGVLAQLSLDEESLFVLEGARAGLELMTAAFPARSKAYGDLATLDKNRGITLAKLGAREEALEVLESAIAAYESCERRFPEDGSRDLELGMVRVNLGTVLSNGGDFDGALEALDRARSNILAAHRTHPDSSDAASWVGVERIVRAIVLLKQQRIVEAAELLAEAPALVAHRIDRVEDALERLVVCVRRARERGDPDVVQRTEASARAGLAAARARGDCDALAPVNELAELLSTP